VRRWRAFWINPVDELERQADEIIAEDLNVIRLRRK
jgi:hypothetical protein